MRQDPSSHFDITLERGEGTPSPKEQSSRGVTKRSAEREIVPKSLIDSTLSTYICIHVCIHICMYMCVFIFIPGTYSSGVSFFIVGFIANMFLLQPRSLTYNWGNYIKCFPV